MLNPKPTKNKIRLPKRHKKRLPGNPFSLLRIKIRKRKVKYIRFIYLVRHAEKENSNDPNSALSQKGFERANSLRDYFSNIPLQLINVSNFIRTQQTAEPTALEKDILARKFNQQNIDTLNLMLIEFEALQIGNILVVGHTNSIPYLIKEFCAVDITPIAENDYDNLYTIAITSTGIKHLYCSTYGQLSP
jgi:phosphohistidine phosphatase SixA